MHKRTETQDPHVIPEASIKHSKKVAEAGNPLVFLDPKLTQARRPEVSYTYTRGYIVGEYYRASGF